jgi:hypothetical protein
LLSLWRRWWWFSIRGGKEGGERKEGSKDEEERELQSRKSGESFSVLPLILPTPLSSSFSLGGGQKGLPLCLCLISIYYSEKCSGRENAAFASSFI